MMKPNIIFPQIIFSLTIAGVAEKRALMILFGRICGVFASWGIFSNSNNIRIYFDAGKFLSRVDTLYIE